MTESNIPYQSTKPCEDMRVFTLAKLWLVNVAFMTKPSKEAAERLSILKPGVVEYPTRESDRNGAEDDEG